MQINIPRNLQTNIEQVRPVPDKYNTKCYIETITLNLSSKYHHPWNDMITVFSANFARVSATQTELWYKLNYQTMSKTNEGKCEAKQNNVMQQCNKPAARGKI